MVTTILTHEVKNFSEWKKGFDADESSRQQAGVKTNGIYTSVDNPNQVTVILEFPSEDVVKGFMGDPDLKVKMEQAGVLGMPETKILNKM